jgi:Putative metallopeptidase
MTSYCWKRINLIIAVASIAFLLPRLSLAQLDRNVTNDPPNRVSVVYIPPINSSFKELHDVLRNHRALEKVQEILSPLRSPEELTIKTAECGVVNSWYRRENLKPTITIRYEFLNHILGSLSNEPTTDGITGADAAVGQFLWVTLHEVGHATFDIFDVPIFGRAEDAADNFATYILLQFGKEQARRLIIGPPGLGERTWRITKETLLYHYGSRPLRVTTVFLRSVSTIFCA